MNAREIALKIINEVINGGAYANIALANEINQGRLSDQDRRFITELVYGTVKARTTIDWIIGHYVTRPLGKVPPVIRNILRMGVYQLFFLSKVPPSAACNQAVELAKKYGHPGTVKFVNAVLRSAARLPEKVIYPERSDDPVQYIALKYFHPEWMVERWVASLGVDSAEELCQFNNTTPPLSIRTNTLKITRADLLTRLTGEGVGAELSDWTPEGIVCHEYPSLSRLSSLKEGLFQVQDESSMLVGHVLGPEPGEFIIDACGAPGGKSTHIAALMGNRGRVVSTDIYEHKLALTRQNAVRLGIDIITTAAMDAATLHEHYSGQADRVLVDAPCSGLGVLRRKPDSRWQKTAETLKDLPRLQSAILGSAAQCVKPGGILVYSTCTTEPEENGNVVNNFLQSHTEFSLQKTGHFLPCRREGDTVQLWPHYDKVDGFYIARMIRSERSIG
jgi:16S rRNA (cytosine967-C5)-methyltransferase